MAREVSGEEERKWEERFVSLSFFCLSRGPPLMLELVSNERLAFLQPRARAQSRSERRGASEEAASVAARKQMAMEGYGR